MDLFVFDEYFNTPESSHMLILTTNFNFIQVNNKKIITNNILCYNY